MCVSIVANQNILKHFFLTKTLTRSLWIFLICIITRYACGFDVKNDR